MSSQVMILGVLLPFVVQGQYDICWACVVQAFVNPSWHAVGGW